MELVVVTVQGKRYSFILLHLFVKADSYNHFHYSLLTIARINYRPLFLGKGSQELSFYEMAPAVSRRGHQTLLCGVLSLFCLHNLFSFR